MLLVYRQDGRKDDARQGRLKMSDTRAESR